MINIFAAFTIFYVINGLFYLFAVINLLFKQQTHDNTMALPNPFVSVIIPARNEAETIKKCIDCLRTQEYPQDLYEIIPINDASNDDTAEIINAIAEIDNKVRPVHITSRNRENRGKINAIDQGILQAKGDIIITTDADIWMENNWIVRMVQNFDEKTGVMIGVTLDEISKHPVHAFQALDGAGIRVIASALAEINKPITCQGSNLAFRKSAYMEVRHKVLALGVTCGNREWLMQEIDLATDWEIKTQMHPDSIAHTHSPNSWKELINQRSRWASTGKNYSKLSVRFYLICIYFSLLAFIVGPFVLDIKTSGILWGFKLLIDFPVAIAVVRAIQQPHFLYAFPIVFILQPIMVVITAFLGTFGLYRWK